jgi:hypothetical protein
MVQGGQFGYGGRGSKGCDGREEQTKGRGGPTDSLRTAVSTAEKDRPEKS